MASHADLKAKAEKLYWESLVEQKQYEKALVCF
jgi:hypothetical protein